MLDLVQQLFKLILIKLINMYFVNWNETSEPLIKCKKLIRFY